MDAEAVMADVTMPDALAQADANKADAREETKVADAQEGNKDVVAALDSAVKLSLKSKLKNPKIPKNLLISTNLHQQLPSLSCHLQLKIRKIPKKNFVWSIVV
jgi:hypothetical protein